VSRIKIVSHVFPAFAVAFVAELLHEVSGIKVRAPRAMFMNVAVVSELRCLSTVNGQGSFGLGVTFRNVCADLFLRWFDRGRSNLIGVDRLGAFTFLVVIADVTGMGLFAFLA
jgi:hypothetical protein